MEDDLDRVFSGRDEIVPSSGFATSVMESVRREAAAKTVEFPPIAFPWVRALPVFVALVAVLGMLVAGLVDLIRMPAVMGGHEALLPPAVTQALAQANARWIAVAVLVAFVSAFLPVRLARSRH
jgi:hypothetical protein